MSEALRQGLPDLLFLVGLLAIMYATHPNRKDRR